MRESTWTHSRMDFSTEHGAAPQRSSKRETGVMKKAIVILGGGRVDKKMRKRQE